VKVQRLLVGVAAALFVAGCAVGPNYVKPEPSVPDAWHEKLTRGLEAGDADLQTWWTTLNDPELTSLIRRSRDGNLTLRETLARVEEARARRGIAKGEWFPDIAGEGSYQRARSSEDTVRLLPQGQDRNQSFYSTGFDSSWEIDFFGRVRRSVESAEAGLQASVENYRDALVVLFADVALTYVNVRAFQERLRYAIGNVGTQTQTLKLTQDRNAAGLVGDLDVRQAELNLATTEAFVPQLRQSLVQSINRLGVLLGQSPSSLHAELADPAPIPVPPKEVLVELPADLLRQRPDVRAAERQLAAETADIGVATADLYPRFSLLGTFAFDAISVADWIKGSSISYGVGPSFRWSLFDGGRIRSNIEAEDAQADQATAFYEQTVLDALEDVESSIVAYVEEKERRDNLKRAATAAEQATELVNTLYRTGLTDFQNVQDTERQLFIQQDSLAESEGIVTQNLIRLYKALGGGWAP
jgi:NodT family efflux transporter outer membrane factor (OMF) lipoprotein